MLRRLSLLLGLVLLASVTTGAQSLENKVEVFGGYSYMNFGSSPSTNMNGWNLSGEYRVSDWLGGVADFSKVYGSGASVGTYLFGPQVAWPARVSPFAHVLFGGAHFSEGGLTDNSFSVAVGAGIDTKLRDGIYWRMIEGDYVPTHFFSDTQNNVRVSTGIVFRF